MEIGAYDVLLSSAGERMDMTDGPSVRGACLGSLTVGMPVCLVMGLEVTLLYSKFRRDVVFFSNIGWFSHDST